MAEHPNVARIKDAYAAFAKGAWQAACDELATSPNPPGRVESR